MNTPIRMSLPLTDEYVKLLAKQNIYFTYSGGPEEARRKDVVKFDYETRYSRFAAILLGGNLFNIGMFSYSWSTLPLDTIVGNYCSIAWNVSTLGPEHVTSAFTTSKIISDKSFPIYKKSRITSSHNLDTPPIHIGHDVWIGKDVLIRRGVRIGDGAIIGARSIITKDVPPYAVMAGAPARLLRMRFEENIVEKLINSQWFLYDINNMAFDANIPIEQFLDLFYEAKEKKNITLIPETEPFVKELFLAGILQKEALESAQKA